jgi:cell division cycle protein 20 (cofactor of APC complex)
MCQARDILNWTDNRAVAVVTSLGNEFVSGWTDGLVGIVDLRVSNAVTLTAPRTGDFTRVCGIAVNPLAPLIAVGNNEGRLQVFDTRTMRCLASFQAHGVAAVKAVAWSPFCSNVLFTAGGSSDASIRVWDMDARKCMDSVAVGTQITSLQVSRDSNEIACTLGGTDPGIAIFTCPNFRQVGRMGNYSTRVLHSVMSSDGVTLLTLSARLGVDEWSIWSKPIRGGANPASTKGLIQVLR